MDLHNESFISMTAENVEQFEVRIIDSDFLIVVVTPVGAPWNESREIYTLTD